MLSLRNVSKSFRPGELILNDVSFSLNKGEMAILTGASGSCKSTILKLIYGEEKPDRGDLIFDGMNVGALKPGRIHLIRRKIGVIFQDFKLLPERNVWDNIALALEVVGKSRREISTRVTELLLLVGLIQRKWHYPHQLSGGESQRVAIARALANQPLLILADEPSGNLDKDNTAAIMDLLIRINHQGCSVLMATHNIELAAVLQCRRLHLDCGKVSEIS